MHEPCTDMEKKTCCKLAYKQVFFFMDVYGEAATSSDVGHEMRHGS